VRRLILVTSISAPPEVVFDLSTDIDLHQRSLAGSRERAVGGTTSDRIGLGESVTWRARHLGVWWTMTSRIEVLERPICFTDAQVRGPFGSYRHEHRFTAVADGTAMTDVVDPHHWGRSGDRSKGSSRDTSNICLSSATRPSVARP